MMTDQDGSKPVKPSGQGGTPPIAVEDMTPKQLERKKKKEQAAAEKKAKHLAKQAAKAKAAEEDKGKSKAPKAAKQPKPKAVRVVDATVPGQKKDLEPFPASYDPTYVESAWYAWWLEQGFFKPEYGAPTDPNVQDTRPVFMLPMPPPNVTGTLHIGHALTNAIEDSLTRWHRMRGFKTLWNPGCDHAGIATQVVVEKRLQKELNVSRHDIGREAFLEHVWAWRQQKGDNIYEQIKSLGASVDWERACFTMDPHMCDAVNEAFIRMYDDKVIYRDSRLVNWSCSLKSAISNIEVDHLELTGPTMVPVVGHLQKAYEFGVMTEFRYQVKHSDEFITVGTTRLETMLGDTAIAVNPGDARYTHLIGKECVHPFIPSRRIVIVADAYADPSKGTGAVKITPAHDPNDYLVGKRHHLEFINILEDDGSINSESGAQFAGMMRYDARVEIEKALQARGDLVGKQPNHMVVPLCSRSKDIIEMRIKDQWFVDCKDMNKQACQAVKSGELQLIPAMHESTWFHFLENPVGEAWCISRQLWWGHRVPAYSVSIKGREEHMSPSDPENWVVGRNVDEAMRKAMEKFQVTNAQDICLTQDDDVLDTWFSSALFPFAIHGWPNKSKDLDAFYPNSLLETGHDILFFWVARMVVLGTYLTGKLPFKHVYLHPIVRDAHGKKMSKSTGNVVDPVDVIQGVSLETMIQNLKQGNLDQDKLDAAIQSRKKDYPQGLPACGSDALRFTLLSYCSKGGDINLDVRRIEGYRAFGNKLWNAFKFFMYFSSLGNDGGFKPRASQLANIETTGMFAFSSTDRWMLHRLATATRDIHAAFTEYEFMALSGSMHSLWLHDLCDRYIEAIKPVLNNMDPSNQKERHAALETLYTVLDQGLRLLAPVMPFVCEELWQRLPRRTSDEHVPSICVAKYPESLDAYFNQECERSFDRAFEMVKSIRSLRAEYGLISAKTPTTLVCTKDASFQAANMFNQTVQTLASCGEVQVLDQVPNSVAGCATCAVGDGCTVYLDLRGVIDKQKELKKLAAREKSLNDTMANLSLQMGKEDYTRVVPVNIQAKHQAIMADAKKELEHMEEARVLYQTL